MVGSLLGMNIDLKDVSLLHAHKVVCIYIYILIYLFMICIYVYVYLFIYIYIYALRMQNLGESRFGNFLPMRERKATDMMTTRPER